MKNFIVNVFKDSPACTGLVLLLITLHLTGVKSLALPMSEMPKEVGLILFSYLCIMAISVLFILPKTAQHKRRKLMWQVVVTAVLILTVAAKMVV